MTARATVEPFAATASTDPQPPASGFGWLWFGEGVSLLGSATTSVLLPLLAVETLHAGPAWMGVITASAWLPWLIIGLPAGALVDRLRPRTVMIAADAGSAAAMATIPVASWLGALTMWQIGAVAFASGTAAVFFRTAYIKLIPLVVPESGLERANARLMGTESTMQIAGPGLAGVLTSVVSAASGLTADVFSFLVSALCLRRVRPRASECPNVPHLRNGVREGISIVLKNRYLRCFTVIGGLSNFGLTGYGALLVLYLVRDLGLQPPTVSWVLAAGALGGPLGAAAAPRLARRLGSGRASTMLFLISGPAALLIALPTSSAQVWITVAGLVAVSAAVVAGNVVRGAWRQRFVPDRVLGRVVTSSQVINYGTMPLAALTAGVLGDHLGVRATMLLMAAVHALACAGVLLTGFAAMRVLPPRLEPKVA